MFRLSEYENDKRDPGVDILLRMFASKDHPVRLVDTVDFNCATSTLPARILPALLDYSNVITDFATRSKAHDGFDHGGHRDNAEKK